ncbi:HNH endonuclease signature motif containing protein [Hymenobacter mellowenesis]|uniref:HNH endonuclease signature motif containing protein n=1 Tax=Hymenobacter mellowenesis TaxID=3063995 RepID=UPI00350FC7EF
MIRSVEERFWEKVVIRQEGCWKWLAATTKGGYGRFKVGKFLAMAHKVSYQFINGPIPEGLLVRHTCDNPTCVNPAHLELGTQKDNMQDRIIRGRNPSLLKTHCKQGHLFSPENTYKDPDGTRRCKTCQKVCEAKSAQKKAIIRQLKKSLNHAQ